MVRASYFDHLKSQFFRPVVVLISKGYFQLDLTNWKIVLWFKIIFQSYRPNRYKGTPWKTVMPTYQALHHGKQCSTV